MKNTLQTLQKKRKSKKGSTLMEMLIVVAIIAILVAIAIPVFTAQLDEAQDRVDEANERSAKSMAVAEYLLDAQSGEAKYYVTIDSNNNMTVTGTEPASGTYYEVTFNSASEVTGVTEKTK